MTELADWLREHEPPQWQRHQGTAMWLRREGNLAGAIEEELKAIEQLKSTPHLEKETAITLNFLGDLYFEKGDLDQAERTLREAIQFCRLNSCEFYVGDNLLILARLQRSRGDRCAALASAEESRRSYEAVNHRHGKSQAELLIAEINCQR